MTDGGQEEGGLLAVLHLVVRELYIVLLLTGLLPLKAVQRKIPFGLATANQCTKRTEMCNCFKS